MRKEPIVFLLFAAVIGWQYSGMKSESSRARRPRPRAKDYVSARIPDVDLAIADPARELGFERDLFSPPSPTQPLPPLSPMLPPLEPLGALTPPSPWGPEARHFGDLMRVPARPANATSMPGLFDVEDGGDLDAVEDEIEELAADVDPLEELDDADAKAARIAGLKKQYDWIFTNDFRFGRIQNASRYTPEFLDPNDGPGEPIEFLEFDTTSGRPRFASTLTFNRDQIDEFGLVDNAETLIEVGHASFPEPIPGSRFDEAIRFANQCLLLRNESDRALEVAEDLFTRTQAVNLQDEAGPRLGLARCYELGFNLEDAWKAYQDLLSSGHDSNPVVHARLAELMAKLRLDGEAEESFQRGLDAGRSNWEALWRYGRWLVARERASEAVPLLKDAVLREPKAAEDRPWRVRVRLAYAGALLAAGQPDEAFDAFAVARSADAADEVGLGDVVEAGQLAAARLSSRPDAQSLLQGATGGEPADGDFEALLSAGLVAMDQGRFEDAAQTLLLASNADPFRAGESLRALSRLAEITDNPEDAVRFADEALAANPTDPWTLVHRGRLAQESGDVADAELAYRAALDQELDLVPALERMAELMQRAGDHDAAERYYARAVRIAPEAAQLHSRRGWNALSLGDLELAEDSFRESRRLDAGLVSARAGLAWWQYAAGDTVESLTLFSEIVDDRRAQGLEDPLMAYAEAQADRIRDHDSKEVFSDRFDRANGRIGNNWKIDQGFGPLVDLVDGQIVIDGVQDRNGRTRFFRSLPPDRFLAFSCEVVVGPKAKNTVVGVFLSSERTRSGGEGQTMSEILLARGRNGELQVKVLQNPNDSESAFTNVLGPSWSVGDTVRLAIQRSGEDLDSRYTLYVQGEPVAQDLSADRLTSSRQPVNFGVFVEGEAGRVADVTMDNVRVERRK